MYSNPIGTYRNFARYFSTTIDADGHLTFITEFGVDTLIDIEIIDFDGTLFYIVDPNANVFSNEIDVLFATDADNIIRSGDGADIIHGQLGNDTIFGELGDDVLYGGLGNDSVFGGDGHDYLEGAEGDDILNGGDGDDNLTGGSGDDLILGGLGLNIIDGGAGVDGLSYAGFYTNVNVNLVTGITSTVYTDGDIFSNIENIEGTDYDDVLIGNDQDNILAGGFGADYIDGGAGNDTIDYSGSSSGGRTFPVFIDLARGTVSNGPAEGDVLISIENIIGGGIEDTLSGDENDNIIEGRGGGDTITGRGGNDTVSYRSSPGAVQVNLGTNEATGHDAYRDSFSTIENLWGSSYDDTLTGDTNDNSLKGWAGNDTLTGGAGRDRFVFGLDDGQDVITDFTCGEDVLELALSPYMSLSDVLAMFTDHSGYTLLDMGGGNTVRLEGVSVADLSADDFALNGIPEDGIGPFRHGYVVMPEKGTSSRQDMSDDSSFAMVEVVDDFGFF